MLGGDDVLSERVSIANTSVCQDSQALVTTSNLPKSHPMRVGKQSRRGAYFEARTLFGREAIGT